MEGTADDQGQRLKACILPDRTELQERILKAPGDVIIGDHSQIEYGITGYDVFIAELSHVRGDIRAKGDLRIGNFCQIDGNLIADADAYIGEGVRIKGKLTVMGGLDIGDNVVIDKGFDVHGDIEIRNPMPVIIYIILYVMTMLRMEREEEIDRFLEFVSDDDGHALVLPSRSRLDESELVVAAPIIIGAACRLHGLIKGQNAIIGPKTTVFGSIRATDSIMVAPGVMIHGNIEAADDLIIEEDVHVLGNVEGRRVTMDEEARIEGLIRSAEGLTIKRRKR